MKGNPVDIMLDLEQLREARAGLTASIEEFQAAADTNDDLEGAIERPDGRSALLDRVIDFEIGWRDKRGKLTENLTNIKDQLISIIDGWDEWDTGTAQELESSTTTETVSARKAV